MSTPLHDLVEDTLASITPPPSAALCKLFGEGADYAAALTEVGATWQAVHGQRRVDAVFAARIDAALMQGRDPDLAHGESSAWAASCRCPECREAHHS